MAATRLIALHKNKGKSVAACLKSRTDYAQNPDKTEQGQLVSSYKCSPLTVDEEFMLSKRQYELVTGRRQKSDVIALNCTPFVRQYGILFKKWGVFVCRKRKSKRHIVENSK